MGAQALEEGKPKIHISSFSITFAVVATRKSSGDLAFEVPGVEAGAERGFSTSATHSMTITMSLSEKTPVTPIASSLGILPAIQHIRSTLRKACSVEPKFKTNAVNFTIEFAIVKTKDNRYRFQIIEAQEPEYKRYVTHQLSIQMSPCD